MGMTYKTRNLENINQLADHTKAKALQWHEFCESNGIDILIYETIRTKKTQEQYVANGVSQTMKSYHLVGQALDFVPVVNGKAKWDGYGTANIKKAVTEAKRLGFEWGGDWKGFVDKPHLQYNHKGYGTDTFGKTVAPSAPVEAVGDTYTIKKGDTFWGISKQVGVSVEQLTSLNQGVDPKKLKVGQVIQLKAATSPKPVVTAQAVRPYPGKALTIGSRGRDVEAVQRALGFSGHAIDGVFGRNTANAVRAYQQRKGLVADAIVGQKTWNMLF